MFGVLLGVLTGLFVDHTRGNLPFIIGGMLQLIGYTAIGLCFDGQVEGELDSFWWFMLLAFIFLVGQGSSIIMVSSVKINYSNFTHTSSSFLMGVLASSSLLGHEIEKAVRISFFHKTSISHYQIFLGCIILILSLVAPIVMKVDDAAF